MSKALAHLERYLDGWKLGDGEKSLQATVEDFYYDDPNSQRIQRSDFVNFVEDFKADAAKLTGGVVPSPFLEYTDTVISDGIAWCWWCVNGTDFQGSAVIHFSEHGIVSEKIAYFSRLPFFR